MTKRKRDAAGPGGRWDGWDDPDYEPTDEEPNEPIAVDAASDAEPRPPAMRFDKPGPTTLKQWSQTAARLNVDVPADELENIAEALPEAFESAADRCPDWASATARHVCGRVVAHARKAAGRTAAGTASFAQEPDASL